MATVTYQLPNPSWCTRETVLDVMPELASKMLFHGRFIVWLQFSYM